MKKIIILSNVLLASSLVTGTSSDLFPLKSYQFPVAQEIVIKADTQENISFNIIKERNASVAKAEKIAKEEAAKTSELAALKAQQESEKVNNITNKQENNETSNIVNKRESTVYVRGIKVTITESVSDSDYNTFINWINNMPEALLKNVNSISVVDDVDSISGYDRTLGVTVNNGKDIYITSENLSSRKTTLYHEAGHSLDHALGGNYRYSQTSAWKNINASEWSNEGYYSSLNESFAEAVSRYYIDGLNKSQSYKAIEQVITTGKIEEESEFKDISVTLYAKDKNVQVVDLPDRKATTQLGTIKPYESIEAIGVNQRGTYYKVIYNGQIGYVNASSVSTQ